MANKKSNRETELEQQIGELTADLKRIQADFINYRARMEDDRSRAVLGAKAATIMKLLPVIDNIERALGHAPAELADNPWVKGVTSLQKSLEKSLSELGVTRIVAVGAPFDPNLHEAISAEGEGSHEVVAEELRAGYLLDGQVIRHSLVKVAHQNQSVEPPEVAREIIQDTKATESQTDEVKGED